MNSLRLLSKSFKTSFDEGAWFKIRHAVPSYRDIFGSLKLRRNLAEPPALSDNIVVVGAGMAALSCLKKLKAAGFQNIQVVTRDQLYGGKCVNFGCMPAEFVFASSSSPDASIQERLGVFVEALRSDVERAFKGFGYPVIPGEVARIAGKSLELTSGQKIPFDRLVLAIGSKFEDSLGLAERGANLVSIEDFWGLPPGSRVAICAEKNLSALALGAIALRLGLVPTVVLIGADPFLSLPSVKYYVRTLVGLGAKVLQDVRIVGVSKDALSIRTKRDKIEAVDNDFVVVASRPQPNFLEIDGAVPSLFDFDLATGTTPGRGDILFLGDGAGYFTAAEAERQAAQLTDAWIHNRRVDIGSLESLPMSLHATRPLTMLGAPWTYLENDWIEIDFAALGWSKAHGMDGKLWYLLNKENGRVAAVHICHPLATELTPLAAALCEYPVSDHRWHAATVHPSAAEIFSVLADDARAKMGGQPAAVKAAAKSALPAVFQLPDLQDLSPAALLPAWLPAGIAAKVLTSRQPRQHLAGVYALWRLSEKAGIDYPARLVAGGQDGVEILSGEAVTLTYDPLVKECVAASQSDAVTVRF